jgi:hypothetical protein
MNHAVDLLVNCTLEFSELFPDVKGLNKETAISNRRVNKQISRAAIVNSCYLFRFQDLRVGKNTQQCFGSAIEIQRQYMHQP